MSQTFRRPSRLFCQKQCTFAISTHTSIAGYIAQWLEWLTADQQVPGSSPGVPFIGEAATQTLTLVETQRQDTEAAPVHPGALSNLQLAPGLSRRKKSSKGDEDALSSFSQQLFSAIILLWSGVGGQLVTSQLSSCCGQGLVIS